MKSESKMTAGATIKRGGESWTYYYVVLAIVLSLESSIIQLWAPSFPWGLLIYLGLFVITVWLFLTSGWVHNKLAGLKASYEDKFR